MNKKSFESVIPTALYTAYPLIYTDIPYAKEMYELLDDKGFPDNLKNINLVVSCEARYKLIDKLLKETGITQILELASGYTARGLAWCKNNPNITYVELDLPKVIKHKLKMVKQITKIPSNIHYVSGNAVSKKDFNKCYKYFDLSKPVAVINQGLMRYLNFEEKETLAELIYELISKNNGAWITCDITPVNPNNPNLQKNEIINSYTDRNVSDWRYKDRSHVQDVFGKIGLDIEWHELMEAKPLLTSTQKLELDDNFVNKHLNHIVVGVMRPTKF